MFRLESGFTLGIFLAVACGCGGGSGNNADASTPTATGGVLGQGGVSAPGGGMAAGGVAATGGAIPTGGTGDGTAAGGATATGGTPAGASATVGTGTGTATATGTGTSTATATVGTGTSTATATFGTGTRTATATAGTGTGTATATVGTGTRTATATVGTGTATTSTTSGTGACNVPLCLNDLVSSCAPDGACVEQKGYMCGATVCPEPFTSAPTSMFNYMCYANGVHVSTTADMTNPTSQTSIQTYKKNGTVCYSVEMPLSMATATSVTMVVKNPAGATLATEVFNQTARTVTITCTGGSPAVVSLDCLTPSSADGGTPCTTGTCAP